MPNDRGSIFASAFWTLGVSTRDDARRILEVAEERSLTLDPEVCATCRDALTNPRKRLREEVRWLPGLSPRRANELASALREAAFPAPPPQQLPALAAFNLAATTIGGRLEAPELTDRITRLAVLSDIVSVDEVLKEVNEDRAIAHFPMARMEQVEEELTLHKAECAARTIEALGNLPTAQIIALMTDLAEEFTSDPDEPPPDFFSSLIELYEVEAQNFLAPEAESVATLCNAIRGAAVAGEPAIQPLLRTLQRIVRRWDTVAQPIQLLAHFRGLDHAASAAVGRSLRSLSLDLHNNLQMTDSATLISELCSAVFAELPEFGDRVRDDLDILFEFAEARQADQESQAQWARDITYEGEVGSFIKHRIAISPLGVEWKDARLPLEDVQSMRWGGTQGRSGSTYTIALSGKNQSMEISFSNHTEVFSAITSRLWRSVGVQILLRILKDLREGKRIYFGQVLIDDASAELKARNPFGNGGVARFPWTQISHANHNGELWLSSTDKKGQSALSYLYDDNTHVLSAILNIRKEKKASRLSDIFEN